MLVQKVDQSFVSPSLPIYDPSAMDKAVAAIPGLNVWLEASPDYFQLTPGDTLDAWVSRIDGRRFERLLPASTRPDIFPSGSGRALHFERDNSGVPLRPVGTLKAEDDAPLLSASGKPMTVAVLTRMPPEGTESPYGDATSYSGVVVGTAYASSGDLGWFQLTQRTTGNQRVYHQSGGTVLINTTTVLNDNVWHYSVYSYDPDTNTAVMRTDGVEVGRNTNVTEEIATDPRARVLRIGGAKDGTSGVGIFVGNIGGVFNVQDNALHLPANSAHLAALEAKLAAMKAALT